MIPSLTPSTPNSTVHAGASEPYCIVHAQLATFDSNIRAPYGLLSDACVVWQNGRILSVGQALPENIPKQNIVDAKGKLVTPGLVDCHTHLVFGGDRADEFERRLAGASYAEIAQAGGGILSTVNATRAASEDELFEASLPRLKKLAASGVTTVEIKSGYGLSLESEVKMLRVIQRLGQASGLHIDATCLAAHSLPPEFAGRADDYIALICDRWLPEIADQKLANAVDIFCEHIAFTAAHAEQLFTAATSLGLKIKGHTEQLSQCHGTDAVAQYSGLSADHLEYANAEQMVALAKANAAAVLLPGAFYYLGETQLPPIQAMRDAGVAMAVATDANPGSSPIYSLTQAANMACMLFGLSIEEAWTGMTAFGAKALGLEKTKGCIAAGYDADLLLWPGSRPVEVIQSLPTLTPLNTWIGGELCQTTT